MREIKFRAWDRKQLQMVYGKPGEDEWTTPDNEECYQPVTVYQKGIIYCRKGKWGKENDVKDENGRVGFMNWEYDQYYQECDIMQFTGLLDKNGKEIYEGDIVRWSTSFNQPDAVMEVKFEKDILGGRYTTTPFINDTTEVIGNIYENPDLLKETK